MKKRIMMIMALICCCCLYGCGGIMEAGMAVSELYRINNRPDYKTTLNWDLKKACAATETALRKLDIQIQDRQKGEGEITIRGDTSGQKIHVVLREISKTVTRIEIKTTDRDPQFALLIANEIKKN